MYKLTLSTNINAENNYFNKWLRNNYSPNFRGTSQGGAMYIYFDSEPDDEIKLEILDFYNTISEADCLHVYQTLKMNEFRIKTNQLISEGYIYSGKTFALSRGVDGNYTTDPQTNILALYTSREQLSYPVIFMTIDGFDYFVCLDSRTIEAMYLAALATKKAHEDSGTTLIQSVTNSTTRLQVESIVDPR